jgi:hypothetical protein
MKFQVPQFIETETKVIGPFTIKQFLFVAGGIAMGSSEFLLLPNGIILYIAEFLTIAFFGGLAFGKVDGQPLLSYAAYALAYLFGTKRSVYQVKKDEGPIIPTNYGN